MKTLWQGTGVLTLVLFSHLATPVYSASPDSVLIGKQLFERTWEPGHDGFGGDGLGPVFNASSCVACHNLGGVGGAGRSQFNATSVGIERMRVTGGLVDNKVVAKMISTFHPGFIRTDGSMVNVVALGHHGGSNAYESARRELLDKNYAELSKEGGPANPSETRLANASPIQFENQIGPHRIQIEARTFQRNTTALFGAGLIDRVSKRDIERVFELQKRHKEISGRPSTLRDGRYGRFGWRGNLATLLEFTDQACANELGLSTRRRQQPADPTVRYSNENEDIADQQIIAMRDFIAALPAPTQVYPTDSHERAQVQRGEQLFKSVGCSVCHVQNMGPAKGVYSDMLLHDMGYETMDLSGAKPYIKRYTPITETRVTTTQRSPELDGYYGTVSLIDTVSETRSTGGKPVPVYEFFAPRGPSRAMDVFELASQQFTETREFKSNRFAGVNRGRDINITETRTVENVAKVRLHFEPTNINQEWKTAPLWGVADSAPYMHDGRAATLLEAIAVHEGESAGTRDRFLNLSLDDRLAVESFLKTLVAPQVTQ